MEGAVGRLERLREEALGCRRCDLWRTRTQVVFGAGDPRAELMLVGEGPGEQEDVAGRPFVGRAGRLLDQLLERVGLARDEIWLTNTVKSRPVLIEGGRKKNRPPRVSEVKACAVWLDGELELIRPKVVLCLGAVAAKRLIRKDFRLTEERGRFYDVGGRRMAATLHPAYVLRLEGDDFTRARETLQADVAAAKAEAERLRASSARAAP
jgi:uracil-DNA glycosylase family protein